MSVYYDRSLCVLITCVSYQFLKNTLCFARLTYFASKPLFAQHDFQYCVFDYFADLIADFDN